LFVSYGEARRSPQYPEGFGTGILEGVAAPETGNNAAAGGAMIPMLTLGVPGDAVTAVLMGALTIHNFQPGPLLITSYYRIRRAMERESRASIDEKERID